MSKKNIWFLIMAFLYVGAGINHFLHPGFYLKIMPRYLPYPLELIFISGIFEIILGFAMLPLRTRKTTSLLIIAMLVVFTVVHVQMIIDTYADGGIKFWIAVFRLPLQYILIRWSWLVYKKYTKPFNFKRPVYK